MATSGASQQLRNMATTGGNLATRSTMRLRWMKKIGSAMKRTPSARSRTIAASAK